MISAATTTSMGSICRQCGIMRQSGKASCCTRGGSWFRTCGSARSTHLPHTWHEGIQACKAQQFQPAISQQLKDPQLKSNVSTIGTTSKAIIVAARLYESKPGKATTPIQVTTSIAMPNRMTFITLTRICSMRYWSNVPESN